MSATDAGDFRRRIDRVAAIVEGLETRADPASREAARELVRALLDLHAAGLSKVLELAGGELVDRLARDGLVGGLLLLHGLHPHSAHDRVNRVLVEARSRLRALGGNVELIGATDEVVKLRLRGDASANAELRAIAESLVLEAVPDAALEFEEDWDPPTAGRHPLPLLRGAR